MLVLSLLVVATAGVAFQLGLRAGRAEVGRAVASTGWVDEAARHELVDLLARVEAGAAPDGGASRLTFPTALRQGAPADAGPMPDAAVAAGAAMAIPPSAGPPAEGDPAPDTPWCVEAGRFGAPEAAVALRDHLRAAGLAAAATLQLVDGVRTHVVLVPGGADEAAAQAVVLAVEAAEAGVDLEVAAPVVIPPS